MAKCNTIALMIQNNKDMATIIKRKATSFRLPSYLLEGLKKEARRQHRSVNSLVEVVLLKSLYNEPNAETLAAMKECESGVELENFDPNELDKYIYGKATEEVDTV
jgi:hypothetical protein